MARYSARFFREYDDELLNMFEQHMARILRPADSPLGLTTSSYGDKPPAAKSEVLKLVAPTSDKLLGEKCPICLCEYQGKVKALTMPCKHIFHSVCLKKWLRKSNFCPLCKFELKTDDRLYEKYKSFTNQIRL